MASDSSQRTLVQRMFSKLNREHFHSSIPTPEIRLSRRMTASAGLVQYGEKRHTLVISIPYHDHFGWDGELLSTLTHEMVHLYLERYRGIRGHGKVFSSLCAALGTERYCKELPDEGPIYVYKCPRCGTEYRYRRKVRLHCGSCYPHIHHNSSRLRLIRTIPPQSDSKLKGKPLPDASYQAARPGRQLTLPGLNRTMPKQTAARKRKTA